MHDDMNEHKRAVLADLMGKMKELEASSFDDENKPHDLEIHEIHAGPLNQDDVEKLEEKTHMDLDNDNEEGESPEHKAAVLGSDDESDEDSEDEESPLPPALMSLLASRMKNK